MSITKTSLKVPRITRKLLTYEQTLLTPLILCHAFILVLVLVLILNLVLVLVQLLIPTPFPTLVTQLSAF